MSWIPAPGELPDELRAAPRWVRWKLVQETGNPKGRKVPLFPSSRYPAKSTDPSTWGSFDAALAHAGEPPSVGLGFVLGRNGVKGYVGIDLDHVRDAETGELAAEAVEIIRRAGTYAEVSPSGTGVKLFGVVPIENAPLLPRNKADLDDGGELEVYARGRYFTVTGQRLPESPRELVDLSETLEWLIVRYLAREAANDRQMVGKCLPGACTVQTPDSPATEAVVRRASLYLAAIPGAVSGQDGHGQTWGAALRIVRGFGLTEGQALDLLVREFNPRCVPPWSERELAHKVRQAQQARVPAGFLLEERNAESTAPVTPSQEALFFTAAEDLRQRRPLGPAVAIGLPTLDGFLEGGLRSGTHAVLVGPPESGKTTFGAHCVARWIDAAAENAALAYARDEAPGALINRFAQRLGFDRAALRRNDPSTCERAAVALEERWGARLQLMDPFRAPLDVLLEKAAEMRRDGPLLVLVDSLQVAQTTAGGKTSSQKDRIDAAMAIGSELAARGDLVLSLSQSSRAGYAEPKNGRDPRAEGSGSAGIEFNADVLLGFTSKADDDPAAPRTVTVRKGRGGLAKGTVSFVVDRETTVIREVDQDAAEEAECHAVEAKLRPYQDALLAELRMATAAGEKRSGRYLEQNVPGGTPAIRKALKALVVAKAVFVEDGPRGALLYYAPTSPDLARPRPDLARGAVVDDRARDLATSPPPYKGARSAGRGQLTRGDAPEPDSKRGAPGRGQVSAAEVLP